MHKKSPKRKTPCIVGRSDLSKWRRYDSRQFVNLQLNCNRTKRIRHPRSYAKQKFRIIHNFVNRFSQNVAGQNMFDLINIVAYFDGWRLYLDLFYNKVTNTQLIHTYLHIIFGSTKLNNSGKLTYKFNKCFGLSKVKYKRHITQKIVEDIYLIVTFGKQQKKTKLQATRKRFGSFSFNQKFANYKKPHERNKIDQILVKFNSIYVIIIILTIASNSCVYW